MARWWNTRNGLGCEGGEGQDINMITVKLQQLDCDNCWWWQEDGKEEEVRPKYGTILRILHHIPNENMWKSTRHSDVHLQFDADY